MTRFLEHYTAWITPLSPIHIGTGEDYEPTNSALAGSELIHFDPLALGLEPEERDRLTKIIGGLDQYGAPPTLLKIRGFFSSVITRAPDAAIYRIPLPRGVVEHIRSTKVGAPKPPRGARRQRGNTKQLQDVINQLAIPRSIRHPHAGMLYLPGTSLKGALRTAWLEYLLAQERPKIPPPGKHVKFEQELLGGKFATDPFRLIKIGDAVGDAAGTVLLVLDVARKSARKNDPAVMTMAEVVVPAQFRIWKADFARIVNAGNREWKNFPSQIFSFRDLLRSANIFSLSRWHKESRELNTNRFLANEWMSDVQTLIGNDLKERLRDGGAALLRLGHYSGEEFVRYGNDVRRRTGNPLVPRKKMNGRETTPCIRLAGRGKNDREALPFGWVLVELAPAGEEPPECPQLEEFCNRWGGWAAPGGAAPPRPRPPASTGPAPAAGAQSPKPQAEPKLEIDIPDSRNGYSIRTLRDQVAKFPDEPEKYQAMLSGLVNRARGWSAGEKAALVAVVEKGVRPRLGGRAESHPWKPILQQVEKLKQQG